MLINERRLLWHGDGKTSSQKDLRCPPQRARPGGLEPGRGEDRGVSRHLAGSATAFVFWVASFTPFLKPSSVVRK